MDRPDYRNGVSSVTDEERSRAVAELRKASTGEYRHVDMLDVIANSIGVDIVGKFDYEFENETYAALANLIDRPTCNDVADFDRESFKCSRCGYRVLSIDGTPDAAKLVGTKGGVIDFGYCPNCGAVVVDEGGCDVP